MEELRRLAMQFAMHKSMTSHEFAALFCIEVLSTAHNERAMLAFAELFLNAKPSGEG